MACGVRREEIFHDVRVEIDGAGDDDRGGGTSVAVAALISDWGLLLLRQKTSVHVVMW